MSPTEQNKTLHKRKWKFPFTEENLPLAKENSTIPKKGAFSTRKQKEQLPRQTVLSLHAIAVLQRKEEEASGAYAERFWGGSPNPAGVWGALWAPQRGPGQSHGRFWN